MAVLQGCKGVEGDPRGGVSQAKCHEEAGIEPNTKPLRNRGMALDSARRPGHGRSAACTSFTKPDRRR